MKTLSDLIAFNNAHADTELKFFGQEIFELADSDPFSASDYAAALADDRRLGGKDGIDQLVKPLGGPYDALIAPTGSPAWTTDLINGDHFLGASSFPSAMAGYPIINVPAGSPFGVPVGISFIASQFSEPLLIKLASGFEAVTKARIVPQLKATLPDASLPAPKGSAKNHGLPSRTLPAFANL
jgi:amidase